MINLRSAAISAAWENLTFGSVLDSPPSASSIIAGPVHAWAYPVPKDWPRSHVWSRVDPLDPKPGHILLLLVPNIARPSHPARLDFGVLGFTWSYTYAQSCVQLTRLFNVDGSSLCRQVYRPRLIRANFASHRAPPPWMTGRFSEHFCHRVYYTSIPVLHLLYFHDLHV